MPPATSVPSSGRRRAEAGADVLDAEHDALPRQQVDRIGALAQFGQDAETGAAAQEGFGDLGSGAEHFDGEAFLLGFAAQQRLLGARLVAPWQTPKLG